MQKIYIQPSIEIAQMEPQNIVCYSHEITSDKDINYGGVDEDGERDPESREVYHQYDVWEEDEEDD